MMGEERVVKQIKCVHIDVVTGGVSKEMRSYGGAATEGFDFYVPAETDRTEMENFLGEVLRGVGYESFRICWCGESWRNESNVWTKEEMAKCIDKNRGLKGDK